MRLSARAMDVWSRAHHGANDRIINISARNSRSLCWTILPNAMVSLYYRTNITTGALFWETVAIYVTLSRIISNRLPLQYLPRDRESRAKGAPQRKTHVVLNAAARPSTKNACIVG